MFTTKVVLLLVNIAEAGWPAAAAVGATDPPEACGPPLRTVRAMWMAAEHDRGPGA